MWFYRMNKSYIPSWFIGFPTYEAHNFTGEVWMYQEYVGIPIDRLLLA